MRLADLEVFRKSREIGRRLDVRQLYKILGTIESSRIMLLSSLPRCRSLSFSQPVVTALKSCPGSNRFHPFFYEIKGSP